MRGLSSARRLAVWAALLAVVAGRLLRSHLGLEMSSASIQAWVDHLGWTAPAIYLALVVFRHFLLIPSTVVIAAGGLCFGAATGAGLGALGIALCGLGQFAHMPITSVLQHFREEVEDHVLRKRCPAGVCSMRSARMMEVTA